MADERPLTKHPDYTEYTITNIDEHAALEKAKREAWNETLRQEIEALITEDTDDG